MTPQVFSSSFSTDNSTVNATFRGYEVPAGTSLILNVEYFAISSVAGKRISGKARAVFTNVAGTATILDAKVDPYEKRDASGGFSAGALGFSIASNVVTITGTGFGGQGATVWSVNIESIYV